MGRSPCCEKAHTNKGAWTKEEDQRLINYIRVHGEGCWRSLPKAAGLLRCGKSCRLRWINYLRPDLKRGNFTEEEDEIIIKLHNLLGNKWSLIAGRLPGRTDNEIKNYWNTHIKRKLISRGIDPQTHRPLNGGTATTTTTVTPTTTNTDASKTAKNICLDFRSSALPLDNKNGFMNDHGSSKFKLTTDHSSAEDTKCSSGTTEESQAPQGPLLLEDQATTPSVMLDLELSIGLPQPKSSISSFSSSAESKVSQGFWAAAAPPQQLTQGAAAAAATATGKPVCLCWQLGYKSGQLCRNCDMALQISLKIEDRFQG
ncbi:unnamed protein product [Coffea canephora]|uniref:Uncharacterized protein n=1 Tax=Coffea canephora TaxID=49390 RepID=A0A068UQX2_COFCA|nr:unnamed protein product [Coffea canephora]